MYLKTYTTIITKYLGRAKNISDYIKHGEDRAMIEISLSRKRGGRLSNVTIQRTFKRNDNKTNWKINGKLFLYYKSNKFPFLLYKNLIQN